MSDPAPITESITPEAQAVPQGDPADKPLGPNGEKALVAERTRADAAEKAARDLKVRLDKIEAANLSDLEKAQKEAAETKAALADITRQNLRNSVALAKGVPADLVEFLTGDTEADIAKKADVLLTRLAVKAAETPGTPKPDLTQGGKGDQAKPDVAPGMPRLQAAYANSTPTK